MKFCDYYSFEYMGVKSNTDTPLLKIETDCTSQSEGQLSTRLEAFAETIGAVKNEEKIKMHTDGKLYSAGIDSGSTSTDAVIMDKDKNIIGKAIVATGSGATNGAKKALSQALEQAGLTEDEAEMYVIESNVMQRGFENLKISEQAAAVALRHSEMFSQGKRNDILRELARLENPSAEPDSSTLNPVGSKLDTSESIGNEYGVSKGSVVRLIRINKLTDELKALVDSGELSIRAGVELSFLSEDTQDVVAECAEDCKIDMKAAKILRASADSDGNIDRNTVHTILYGDDTEPKVKPKSVKISHDIYTKYFSNGEKPKEITETIENALELYFKNMEDK